MSFSLLESIIYGLVTGWTEFIPVSAPAHRALMLKIFGVASEGFLLQLFVHAGALAGVILACKPQIDHLRREQALAKVSRRRRKRQPDQKSLLDIQIVRSAFIPALLGFVPYYFTSGWNTDLSKVAIGLVINGFILYLPQFLPSANKDSRSMSRLDSLLMGLGGALSMLPGISRVGITTSAALTRGADRQQALSWSLLLSIPLIACLMILDFYGIITQGIGTFSFLLLVQYILSAAAACASGYFAISFLRFMAVNAGFAGFAYYSWGAALFSFILYLTI